MICCYHKWRSVLTGSLIWIWLADRLILIGWWALNIIEIVAAFSSLFVCAHFCNLFFPNGFDFLVMWLKFDDFFRLIAVSHWPSQRTSYKPALLVCDWLTRLYKSLHNNPKSEVIDIMRCFTTKQQQETFIRNTTLREHHVCRPSFEAECPIDNRQLKLLCRRGMKDTFPQTRVSKLCKASQLQLSTQ